MPEGSQLLMREIAVEVGDTVEEGLALVLDRAQEAVVALRRQVVAKNGTDIQQVAAPVLDRMAPASFLIPFVGGRVAATATYWGMRSGLRLVRTTRRRIQELR